MPARLLYIADALLGFCSIMAALTSGFLMSIPTDQAELEQLKVLLVPMLGATFATVGMILAKIGHEPRMQLMAKSWFGWLFGTLTLPVCNLFMPAARGRLGGLFDPLLAAMEHPIALFGGGIVGACMWYFVWWALMRALERRADGMADRAMDAVEEKFKK